MVSEMLNLFMMVPFFHYMAKYGQNRPLFDETIVNIYQPPITICLNSISNDRLQLEVSGKFLMTCLESLRQKYGQKHAKLVDN